MLYDPLVNRPEKIKPKQVEQPAALWDICPTINELAGIKTNYNIDGLSLIPLLLNKGKQQQHKYLYW